MFLSNFPLFPRLVGLLCLASLFTLHLAVAQDAQRCYFPDGITLSPDTPCHNGTVSPCCGQEIDGSPAYCLTNGLCLASGIISRGSCTDQTWTSPNCPQYCKGDFDDSGGPIVNCAGYNFSCVNSDGTNNCDSSTFQFPHMKIVLTDAQLLAANLTNGTSTSSPTATITVNPTSGSTCAPDLGTSGLVSSNSTSTCQTTAVGAGVGVPLGLAFLAALGLWLWERRKRRMLVTELSLRSDEFIQMMGTRQGEGGDWKGGQPPDGRNGGRVAHELGTEHDTVEQELEGRPLH